MMDDPTDEKDEDPGREGPDTDPAARIAVLEAELAAAREEARQTNDRWLRERADLENVKKRTARQQAETVRYANEALLRDLLPVVDNLERAVGAASGGGNGKSLAEGVELVLKAFMDALQRNGVERVPAKGAPFDPAVHEAVAYVESPSHPAQQVIEEHQAGYRLNDRLLRPAMVTVSKGRPGPKNLANDEGGG